MKETWVEFKYFESMKKQTRQKMAKVLMQLNLTFRRREIQFHIFISLISRISMQIQNSHKKLYSYFLFKEITYILFIWLQLNFNIFTHVSKFSIFFCVYYNLLRNYSYQKVSSTMLHHIRRISLHLYVVDSEIWLKTWILLKISKKH